MISGYFNLTKHTEGYCHPLGGAGVSYFFSWHLGPGESLSGIVIPGHEPDNYLPVSRI